MLLHRLAQVHIPGSRGWNSTQWHSKKSGSSLCDKPLHRFNGSFPAHRFGSMHFDHIYKRLTYTSIFALDTISRTTPIQSVTKNTNALIRGAIHQKAFHVSALTSLKNDRVPLTQEDILKLVKSHTETPKSPPPTSFTVPVVDIQSGKMVKTVQLKSFIFGSPVRIDLLQRVVVWQRAKQRAGTANTKGRGEKSGSTRKIRKQKGSGMARVGTIRAPHRRGSGAAHGPHPRDWSFSLPRKVRLFALRSALSAKFAQGRLIVVDSYDLPDLKTKSLLETISKFEWGKFRTANNEPEIRTLVIDGSNRPSKNFRLASRNIYNLEFRQPSGFNIYTLLKNQYVVVNLEALAYLNQLLPEY